MMRAAIASLLVAALSKPEVRAPASVLFADDDCDGGTDMKCGTALLQSSMHGRPKAGSDHKVRFEEVVDFWENLQNVIGRLELPEAMKKGQMLISEFPSLQEDPELMQLVHGQLDLSISFCDAELQRSMDRVRVLGDTVQKWQARHGRCLQVQEALKAEALKACEKKVPHTEIPGCHEAHSRVQEKMAECSSLKQVMRTTKCAQSSHSSGMCETYRTCRSSISLASAEAHAVLHQSFRSSHQSIKAHWAIEALHCFGNSWQQWQQQADLTSLLQEYHDCERKGRELLKYQDPPMQQCNETLVEGCHKLLDGKTASLAPMVDQDVQKDVVGVSLMQEGIAVEAAPPQLWEIQQALAGPVATPIAMLVAFFTMTMLGVRCWMTGLGPQRRHDASPKSVDAWCVNSLEKLSDTDHPWLCAELVVPKKSHCIVLVPTNLDRGALVTDKMGQGMFRSSRTELPSGEIQLLLSRCGGQVLATACYCPGKNSKSWQVYQGSGDDLFASLEWEDAQSSWFSKSSPGAFVLRDKMRQSLLRALPNGPNNPNCGGIRLCDALGRLVAMVEPMTKGEGLKLEVKSETTTDLGLLTLASLAIHSFSETEDAVAL